MKIHTNSVSIKWTLAKKQPIDTKNEHGYTVNTLRSNDQNATKQKSRRHRLQPPLNSSRKTKSLVCVVGERERNDDEFHN